MEQNLNFKIGQRISKLRHDYRLSQNQLSEILEISVKHLSEVERGLSRLSIDKLMLLCDKFSVSLDYLIRGIDNVEGNGVPSFVVDLYNSSDSAKREAFEDYVRMFQRIYKS